MVFLFQRELSDWIAPNGFEHADSEAKHLIYNADSDKVQGYELERPGIWDVKFVERSIILHLEDTA